MMANEIGTPTLESAPLSNAFYKGDSAYEIAVKHGFTGTEEEWLALMHPLIVQATKQAKAEGDTSAAETYVADHTAKEIYDAASAGRIVKLYVPQSSESNAGGAYYQLSSYSYNSKLDKYTLLFTKPGSAIYENDAGKTGYKDGDGTAYLPGVRVRHIEGMLMDPDSTTLKSSGWSAYDTVPALDLVKTNIRAELAAETTRAETAEKTNADAVSAETSRAKEAEKVNTDAISTEMTRAKAAEQTNAAAITAVSNSLGTETARAEKAEQANAAAITAEATRAKAAEKVNADAIATEVTRAKAAEKANTDAISAETARAESAEKTNADATATETTRAKSAEKANADAITAETTRAKAAEQANTGAITAETARAKAAEQANAAAITSETARADKAEKANAAAAAEALSKANEAMEIYDRDNDVKYTYAIYAQQGIPHMALTKVTT